jgi:hypothetical protein
MGLQFSLLNISEGRGERISPRLTEMDDIEKLDNVTWYGHCVLHFMAALKDLPDDAKLTLCQELEKFIKHRQRALQNGL